MSVDHLKIGQGIDNLDVLIKLNDLIDYVKKLEKRIERLEFQRELDRYKEVY